MLQTQVLEPVAGLLATRTHLQDFAAAGVAAATGTTPPSANNRAPTAIALGDIFFIAVLLGRWPFEQCQRRLRMVQGAIGLRS